MDLLTPTDRHDGMHTSYMGLQSNQGTFQLHEQDVISSEDRNRVRSNEPTNNWQKEQTESKASLEQDPFFKDRAKAYARFTTAKNLSLIKKDA
jgi:hypothetical protein